PEYPIMPGVLIAEALAQMGAILIMSRLPNPKEKLVLFAAIDNCKFRRPVAPGDQFRLEVQFVVDKPRVAKMTGQAFVDDKLVAEGTMMCQIVDRPKSSQQRSDPLVKYGLIAGGGRFPLMVAESARA